MIQKTGKAAEQAINTQGRIRDRWDNTTEAQKQKREAQYKQEKANYQRQLDQAGQQYAGMKNQASVSHAMQQRAMRERMANMGMSAAGGTSRTHAQRAANSLSNELGSIKRQHQDHKDNVDFAIGNLGTQYNADIAAIEAGNDAQKNAEQLAYEQWKAGQDLQREQHEAARAVAEAV